MQRNIFERAYLALGRRLNQRLYEERLRSESIQPRLSISLIVVYLSVTIVYLGTLGLMEGIVFLLVRGPAQLIVAICVLALYVFLLLRPEVQGLPAGSIDRKQYPVLTGLTDRVAQALGLRPIDAVVITADFNATSAKVRARMEAAPARQGERFAGTRLTCNTDPLAPFHLP